MPVNLRKARERRGSEQHWGSSTLARLLFEVVDKLVDAGVGTFHFGGISEKGEVPEHSGLESGSSVLIQFFDDVFHGSPEKALLHNFHRNTL